jgi:hypothetical protein
VALCIVLAMAATPATSGALDELYTSKAITTGTGEKNRRLGFRDCLDRVVARVSGDPRLPRKPEMESLRARGGDFVDSFSYRDRLAGRPIHDEQGTYDRPHDLTCRYRPDVLDALLAKLGSRPWRGDRPRLVVFLDVERDGRQLRVVADDMRDLAMRESFALASEALAMPVVFPPRSIAATIARTNMSPDILEPEAQRLGGDRALVGALVWSDADLGWVATWRLESRGHVESWTVRGVSFDEAFRVALGGAMQILSGNGTPE